MVHVSNRVLVALVGVALVIAGIATLVNLSGMGLFGSNSFLTGAVTEGTGTASVTVSGTAALVMNLSTMNLYAGYYTPSCSTGFSKIDTANVESSVSTAVSCWSNASGIDNQSLNRASHRFANNGTTIIQVKGYITSSTTGGVSTLNATSILCGANNCPTGSADALIQVKSINAESSSCSQGLQSSYTNLATPTTLSNVTLCSRLEFDDSNDELNTTFLMQIPRDADQGAKQFTVTYYATAQ